MRSGIPYPGCGFCGLSARAALIPLLLLTGIGAAGTAQAQIQPQPQLQFRTPYNPYLAVDIYRWRFSAGDVATASGTGVRLRGGMFVHPRVALELHGATGGSDTVRSGPDGTTRTQVEFDYAVGAFTRLFVPVADPLMVYGLAGVSRSEYTLTTNGDSDTRDTTGLSYGVGADLSLTPNASLLVEWTRYVDTDDFDSSAVTVGGRLHF